MDLFLIRHADALPIGEHGIETDEERPLSAKGEAQAETLAKVLASRGIALDRFFTSPLVRSRQTAEIMLRTWANPDLSLENCDELAPGCKPRKLGKFLLKTDGEKVGLVGHMPDLAEFIGWLIGDKDARIEMAKCGIALVSCGDAPGKGTGNLEWLVTPAWY